MKRRMTTNPLQVVLGIVSLVALSGCDDLIVSNLLLGARDGALTTTTGIIEGFFEQRFGLEAGDEGHEGEDEHEDEGGHGHEEGGNDSFIRL